MRLCARCAECGFENPRSWLSCARCGCLLGPRLRVTTGSNVGTGPTTGSSSAPTRRALAPEPPAAVVAPEGSEADADAKTGVYSSGTAPWPPLGAASRASDAAEGAPAAAAAALGETKAEAPGATEAAAQPPTETEGETARPAPRSDAPDGRPPFGQEGLSVQLRAALDSAFSQKHALLVVVQGESGSGRTLMLHRASEFAAALRPDVDVHYAALRARDDGPYAPFSRLLLERFGIAPASSPAAVRGAMEQTVAGVLEQSARAGETAPLLGHIAGVPFPDSDLLRQLEREPAALHEQAVAALCRFAAGEAMRRPQLFLLDDIADADAGARDLLQALLGLDVPLALVASGLPRIADHADALARAYPARVLVLDLLPLDAETTAQLVRAMVPDLQELPDELVSALMHRSGGNPRQLVELIKALLAGRVFPRGEGGAFVDLPALERGGLPLTMADTIRARLANLDGAEQQVMRDAAVIGERFWDGALLALARARGPAPGEGERVLAVFASDDDERALRVALDSLEQKGFIVRITDAGASGLREYTFEYAGTRSLIYADLPESERRSAHAQVARWLALTPALSVESFGALLAPHLEHAGAREEAARAYLRAAAEERARMRTTMALLYVDKALSLTDPAEVADRIEALHERGALLTTLGRYDEALPAFEQIVRLAFSLGSRGRGAAALNRIARIYRERGDYAAALDHLRMALALFSAIADQRGVASSHDDMAQIHRMRGELAPALAAAEEALRIRVEIEDRRGQAVSLHTIGRIELDQGRFDSAQTRFTTALKIREALADHEGAVQTRIALGQLAFRRGRIDEAIRIYLAALEAAREMNNQRFQSYTLSFLAEAYGAQNDVDRADSALREAKRLAGALGDQNALANIERILGLLARRSGAR